MGTKDTRAAAACGVWLATCARFKVKLGLSHSPLKLNPEMALQLPRRVNFARDAKATTKRKTRECVSKRKLQMALKTCSAAAQRSEGSNETLHNFRRQHSQRRGHNQREYQN